MIFLFNCYLLYIKNIHTFTNKDNNNNIIENKIKKHNRITLYILYSPILENIGLKKFSYHRILQGFLFIFIWIFLQINERFPKWFLYFKENIVKFIYFRIIYHKFHYFSVFSILFLSIFWKNACATIFLMVMFLQQIWLKSGRLNIHIIKHLYV